MAGENSNLDLNEISILADILSDETGNDYLTIAPQLEDDDFLDERNRLIYHTFGELAKRNIQPNAATVIEEMRNNKTYDRVGGDEYFLNIPKVAVPGPVQAAVNILRDRSLLNKFLRRLHDIETDAQTKPIADIPDFIGNSEASILEITQKRRVAQIMKMSEVSESLVNQLVHQTREFQLHGKKPNGVTGLETGFSNLDRLTKGWKKGEITIVGARPSVGKTAFALNILYQVARRGTPVIFFSLEMKAESIAMRLLSLTANLSTDEINSFEYQPGSKANHVIVTASNPEESSRANNLQRGLQELSSLPFYIDDSPGSKIQDIVSKCKKVKNLIPNVGLIAIDYLGLITGEKADNRQAEVASISRQLKSLARQIDVPLVVLSQLSRDPEKRENHKPMISDLRDSGAIEQDADLILMLYRKDYYALGGEVKGSSKNTDDTLRMDASNPISSIDVTLIKNRNGQTGDMRFIFDKEHCLFNVATDDEEEF